MMLQRCATGLVLAAVFGLVLALGQGSLAAGSPEQAAAKQILEATGVQGGLVVHLGCGDGKLTAALRASESYLVHGLDADAKHVEAARRHIQSLGLEGKISVERWAGNRLPYAENLVNLLVAENLGGTARDEVLRVLAPLGVAYVKSGGRWEKTVKPWPKEIDEWSHYLHDPSNNAVAHDSRVASPKGLQWMAEPLYCRTHETDSSVSALVSARGRIFYILDMGPTGIADERLPQQWALLARDAFSGVPLWQVALPHWGWPEWKKGELAGVDWTTIQGHRLRSPVTLPRRLVTDGDRVYVTLGYDAPVTVLDAATGATVRTCAGTDSTDEILCSQGILVVCVRADRSQGTTPDAAKQMAAKGKKGVGGKKQGSSPAAGTDHLVALKADSGKILWQSQAGEIVPLSVAIDGSRVFFHNYEEVVCLNLQTGAPAWRSPSQAQRGSLYSTPNTLIACQGVVLLNGASLESFSQETGKLLWTAKASKGPGISNPPDLFLAAGLVWQGHEVEGSKMQTSTNRFTDFVLAGGQSVQGRDPLSGEVKKTIELEKLINPWHHFRCYRSKATDHYLMWTKQGAEFIDLVGHDNMRNDWFRGACKLGTMPCNGLLYAPPHQCSCFAGVKLNGFNALTAQGAPKPENVPATSRLERGSAYAGTAKPASPRPNPSDWPSFRGNSQRSGSTASPVPAAAATLWQARLGGKLSQPVVAEGRLLVASIDADRVCCLDAKDGKPQWSFTAGGRIDSPPTIYQGLALFGSADGWVYCVRATDGALAWRFRAAPAERRIVARGQVESAWPVHGTVLLQNGVAYVAAGRSTFLDGGIYVYALDPATGKLLHDAHLEGPYPDVAHDDGGSNRMDGARSEVLVGDGRFVYLRQVKFDGDLKQLEAWGTVAAGTGASGLRLTATSDLLDDSNFNRTAWHYDTGWNVSQGGGDSGQLLVFDATTTYGAQIYSKHVAQSLVYFPGQEYVKLFAVTTSHEASGTPTAHQLKKEKNGRGQKEGERVWSATVPVLIRAMTLAEKTLFIAGLPDTLDPGDPLAVLEGRKGSLLWAVSAADGKKLAEVKLDVPPVFDGMIAAGGRLFLAMQDGRILCLGK